MFRLAIESSSGCRNSRLLTIECYMWKLPASTQLHATWHTYSLDMVVLPSTSGSRYHNCCIDGGTSREYFGYTLVHRCPRRNANIMGGHSIGSFSCKIVDKERLWFVSHTGIFCSNDAVGTVSPVRYTFDNSTVNFNALWNSWEDMACCWSECSLTSLYAGDIMHHEIWQFVSCIHLLQPTDASHQLTCFIQPRSTASVKGNIGPQIQTPIQRNSSASETVRNRTHVYIYIYIVFFISKKCLGVLSVWLKKITIL
jgi:hypothetical protein